MINQAEFDLRIATHHSTVAQQSFPAGRQRTQRAVVPGTLAAKVLALTARFAPHPRQAARPMAPTGTAHS